MRTVECLKSLTLYLSSATRQNENLNLWNHTFCTISKFCIIPCLQQHQCASTANTLENQHTGKHKASHLHRIPWSPTSHNLFLPWPFYLCIYLFFCSKIFNMINMKKIICVCPHTSCFQHSVGKNKTLHLKCKIFQPYLLGEPCVSKIKQETGPDKYSC